MGEVTINALDGVSFNIEQGELCMIVGPSGAGKTTVLNILGGIDDCDDGKIRIGGELINQFNKKRMAMYRRHDVGFVFQFYNLIGNLTALENVELANQICADPLDARQVLKDVGLEARMGNFPSQLSGGEQQRVAIARTLAQGCKIILADEPTGNLDSTNTRNIVEILRSLAHDDGCTVIIVTHDPAVAEQADVVLQMKDGSWI